MQTWLVQMRDPVVCAREMGTGGFIGLQVLMGGFVLSALMHPVFYVLAALELFSDVPFQRPSAGLGATIWTVAAFNLVAGYLAGILLAGLAVWRRGQFRELLALPGMPVYWLLISLAAYRALLQLVHAPHLWEKTTHGSADRSVLARRGGARAV